MSEKKKTDGDIFHPLILYQLELEIKFGKYVGIIIKKKKTSLQYRKRIMRRTKSPDEYGLIFRLGLGWSSFTWCFFFSSKK